MHRIKRRANGGEAKPSNLVSLAGSIIAQCMKVASTCGYLMAARGGSCGRMARTWIR
jgi:hypothetical protein